MKRLGSLEATAPLFRQDQHPPPPFTLGIKPLHRTRNGMAMHSAVSMMLTGYYYSYPM